MYFFSSWPFKNHGELLPNLRCLLVSLSGIETLTQDTLWCFSQVKGTIEIGATEGRRQPPLPLLLASLGFVLGPDFKSFILVSINVNRNTFQSNIRSSFCPFFPVEVYCIHTEMNFLWNRLAERERDQKLGKSRLEWSLSPNISR